MWQSWVDLESSRDTVTMVSAYHKSTILLLTLPARELVRMRCLRLAGDQVLPLGLLKTVSLRICMYRIHSQALGRPWNESASSGLES